MHKEKSIPCLLLLAALLLGGCQKETLDYRNAEIVNGKVYAANANTPFSGMVTNIPAMQVVNRSGFYKFARIISEEELKLAATLCNVQVTAGVLDGAATCKEPRSDAIRIAMAFSEGALDGGLKLYAPGDSGKLVTEVSFSEGEPDGKEEIYSHKTGKLIHVVHWENGILDGTEEGFDENTGKRILLGNVVDGKFDGLLTHYAPDGEQVIGRGTYAQGLPVGVHEIFDATTGKLISHAEFVNGKLQGVFRKWDASGTLISEKTYANGVEVRTPSAGESNQTAMPSASVNACVDSWIVAFRKENGADAVVIGDQLGEWEGWCKAGKHPE